MLSARFSLHRGSFFLNVSFDLIEGGITVLRGSSGAGKTTIADVLSGALCPDDGRIVAQGECFFDSTKHIALPPCQRGIGYVFQTHRLFPHLTVKENILFPQTVGHRLSPISFQETVELLGLEPFLNRKPLTLSGGEGQRVALARALMAANKLLILDEPLSSLDPQRRSLLMDFIERCAQKLDVPILYITHSEQETQRLAHRVLFLHDGQLSLSSTSSHGVFSHA